jgi:hypothetical protein
LLFVLDSELLLTPLPVEVSLLEWSLFPFTGESCLNLLFGFSDSLSLSERSLLFPVDDSPGLSPSVEDCPRLPPSVDDTSPGYLLQLKIPLALGYLEDLLLKEIMTPLTLSINPINLN